MIDRSIISLKAFLLVENFTTVPGAIELQTIGVSSAMAKDTLDIGEVGNFRLRCTLLSMMSLDAPESIIAVKCVPLMLTEKFNRPCVSCFWI